MKYTRKQIINIKKNLEYCEPLTQRDVFKYNHSESLEHNLTLSRQFCLLQKEGFCIAVRPILLNKKIPDLLILSTPEPMVKEVMVTEKEDRFNKKNYLGINKIKVKSV